MFFYNIGPACPSYRIYTEMMELASVKAQNDNRITQWFSEYSRRLLGFVRSRISDMEVAEDLAQDVWLQLSRQTDVGEINQIGNWLFTAARNRITDYYRKKKTVPFSDLAGANIDLDDDSGDDTGASFNDWLADNLPDEVLESKEFWTLLDQALNQLPAEQRDVFVAHELYDIPFRELAEKLGIPINTLLARKRYAVLHLRRVFGRNTP